MPTDFLNNFNTKLDKENETRFQNWVRQTKEKYGSDVGRDLETYDLRGFWLNGGHADESFRKREGHAPDTYKKPNHPTFSDESIYHNQPADGGGYWVGGHWTTDAQGNDVFVPHRP